MPSDSKKLILGFISRLSLEQVKPFFLSLEKSGFHGDVCMVASELGVPTQAFLRSRGVQLIPFQKAYLRGFSAFAAKLPGLLLSPRRRPSFHRQIAPAYMHARCARYFFYQSCLQEFGGNYSHTMLTDVRDVIFQANPFAFPLPEGLSVFAEDSSHKIGSCEADLQAVMTVFGRGALKELGGKPAITTGCMIGTTGAVREYLAQAGRVMCEKRDRRPIDKAVHNFLVYKAPPVKLQNFENFSGPVANLGRVEPGQVRLAACGRVAGTNDRIVNIVHQYDRHPELAQKLTKTLTQ